jgi:hypothetical protein
LPLVQKGHRIRTSINLYLNALGFTWNCPKIETRYQSYRLDTFYFYF